MVSKFEHWAKIEMVNNYKQINFVHNIILVSPRIRSHINCETSGPKAMPAVTTTARHVLTQFCKTESNVLWLLLKPGHKYLILDCILVENQVEH